MYRGGRRIAALFWRYEGCSCNSAVARKVCNLAGIRLNQGNRTGSIVAVLVVEVG